MIAQTINLSAEDLKAYQKERDSFITQNTALINAELKKLGIISQDQLKRSVETAQDKTELYKLLTGMDKIQSELYTEELKRISSRITVLEASDDPDDARKLQKLKDDAKALSEDAVAPMQDMIISAIEKMPGGEGLAGAFRATKEAQRKLRDNPRTVGGGNVDANQSGGANDPATGKYYQ